MPRISFPSSSTLPKTVPVPGYRHFLTPLRKLIFDYQPEAPSQHGVRGYLRNPLLAMAKANPDVEIVVRRLKRGKAAVIRGHYVNGRDKVICVNGLETNEVVNKVNLLLTSSGAKLKSLKNSTLEAAPGGESARGIWSSIHDQSKEGGGYRI
ncbi:large subunit ribosomal protein L43, partial [Tremellales sp. Uapishka_1]